MLKKERHKKILDYLLKNRTVRTSFLSDKLGVSEVTIRKDLKELEQEQLLTRDHGGAIIEKINIDFPLKVRETENIEKKKEIAREALSLIADNDVIFLDAGTTTGQLVDLLVKELPGSLSVITNSLPIANKLAGSSINLKMIGGDFRSETMSLIGPDAIQYLNRLKVDKLFLGASGVSLEYGITNTNIFEAELKKVMISIAREVILLADSSKIDNLALNKVADLGDVDKVITDNEVDNEFKQRVKNIVQLIIAGK